MIVEPCSYFWFEKTFCLPENGSCLGDLLVYLCRWLLFISGMRGADFFCSGGTLEIDRRMHCYVDALHRDIDGIDDGGAYAGA